MNTCSQVLVRWFCSIGTRALGEDLELSTPLNTSFRCVGGENNLLQCTGPRATCQSLAGATCNGWFNFMYVVEYWTSHMHVFSKPFRKFSPLVNISSFKDSLSYNDYVASLIGSPAHYQKRMTALLPCIISHFHVHSGYPHFHCCSFFGLF